MNDLFEVKRYWADSKSVSEEAVDGKEASTKQENDILKRLKLKASIKTPIVKDAKEQERHSHVGPKQETEKRQNEEGNNIDVKRKKKRKRTRKLKDQEEESEKRGGFPILGDNKLQEDKRRRKNIRRTLPAWLSNPDVVSVDLSDQQMPVESLHGLDHNTVDNLRKTNITHFFPVQRQVIPYLLANDPTSIYPPHDICVSAPTGSGKTLAYVLPIGKIV